MYLYEYLFFQFKIRIRTIHGSSQFELIDFFNFILVVSMLLSGRHFIKCNGYIEIRPIQMLTIWTERFPIRVVYHAMLFMIFSLVNREKFKSTLQFTSLHCFGFSIKRRKKRESILLRLQFSKRIVHLPNAIVYLCIHHDDWVCVCVCMDFCWLIH